MFLYDHWYVAGWATEFSDKPVRRTVLGKSIALCRTESGAVIALDDLCPHRLAPLSLGKPVGETLQCPYHGLRFDGAGECVEVPGQDMIPRAAKTRAYPTAERYRWLWVWMGDPAVADPDRIPNFHWLSDPNYVVVTGQYDLKASYEMLLDNLHNHLHLQFVHAKTLGTNGVVGFSQDVQRSGNEVRIVRWLLNQEPPPLFKRAGEFTGLVDRWSNSTFIMPSGVVIDVGCAEAGTGAPEGERGRGIAILSTHAITPETETTCKYYWAYVRSFRRDDVQLSEMLRAGASAAFDEDVEIIEAQQANMSRHPDATFRLHFTPDLGGNQVRRILNEAVRAQNGALSQTSAAE